MIRRFSFLAVALAALGAVGGGGAWGQEAAREAKPAASQPQWMFGVGVNSDAGVTGDIVLKERSFGAAPEILLQFALIEFEPENLQLLAEKNWTWAREIENLWRKAEKEDGANPESWRRVTTGAAARLVQDMRQSEVGRIVAVPTLRVVSGREAHFHSGGEIPLVLPSASGEMKLEHRPIGLHVAATPVYDEGRFRIDLKMTHFERGADEETGTPGIRSRFVEAFVLNEGQAAAVVGVGAPSGDAGRDAWLLLLTPTLAQWAPLGPVAADAAVEITPRERPDGSYKFLEKLQGRLEMMQGAETVVEAPAKIRRVAGFDAETVAVSPVSGNPRRIELRAVAQGATKVRISDAEGKEHDLEVLVTGDAREAKHLIERLYPEADVQVIVLRDMAVLRGAVSHASDIERIGEIVEGLYPKVVNQLHVALAQPAPAPAAPPPPAVSRPIPRSAPPPPAANPLAVAPSPRPSELRELHDEVKLLRRDLNRLIDLLEKRLDGAPPASSRKDPSPPDEIKDVEARKVPPDNDRAAPGSGLRINVPAMGPAPVPLDFAFPIAKAPAIDERMFSFFIGFER